MIIKWSILKIIKLLLVLLLLTLVLVAIKTVKPEEIVNPENLTDNIIYTDLDSPIIVNAIEPISEIIKEKISKIEKTQTRNQRIKSLVSYLSKVKSPIANEHYAGLVIDLAEANGVDYRVVVALMGTESGWCKKPIYYNCFGYLNKQKYASFDDAFNHLIPKISQQYLIHYGWDFAGFVRSYGRIDELSAYNYGRNMYSIAIKLFY